MNATMGMNSALGLTYNYTPFIAIMFMIFVGVLFLVLVSEYGLKWLLKVSKFLKNTFGYAVYGIFTVVIGTLIYTFIKWQVEAVGAGNTILWKVLGYTIVSYFGLTLIGYIVKRFVIDKVKKNWKKVKKNEHNK